MGNVSTEMPQVNGGVVRPVASLLSEPKGMHAAGTSFLLNPFCSLLGHVIHSSFCFPFGRPRNLGFLILCTPPAFPLRACLFALSTNLKCKVSYLCLFLTANLIAPISLLRTVDALLPLCSHVGPSAEQETQEIVQEFCFEIEAHGIAEKLSALL